MIDMRGESWWGRRRGMTHLRAVAMAVAWDTKGGRLRCVAQWQ